MNKIVHALLCSLVCVLPLACSAATQTASAPGAQDPYLWLEEFTSDRAMQWVNAENARTEAALTQDPRYATLKSEALAILGAKDRIPRAAFLHGDIYNFWQDEQNVRGIWRKTSLAEYKKPQPKWTTVLDVTALGKAEGKSWVWRGALCALPSERRCLVQLSEGGEDAATLREFDLQTGKFVDGGFMLPKSKARVDWEDDDTLLISHEWSPGELTQSGYPFVVKRLKRGQSFAQAVEVYRGQKSDGGYGVRPKVLRDGDNHSLVLITRPLDTFNHETYVLTRGGAKQLAIPSKADAIAVITGRVIIQLDADWVVGGTTFPGGSLVWTDLAALTADPAHPKPTLLYTAGAREGLGSVAATRTQLLVSILDNVRGRAYTYSPTKDSWSRKPIELQDNSTIGFASADFRSDLAFVSVSNFLAPSTLYLMDAAQGTLEKIKSLPAKFDASKHVVEQLEATSTDGMKIPYFLVRPRNIPDDGSTPTLLHAYGGFNSSQTPNYDAVNGKLWLERGGAFVLANIRGGGEFGPKWHEAGLGVKRQIVYDDFAAVGKDLIARKITSARRLGIEGGSNGGLLMGVEFVQQPQLWNAVIIDVPLLDMIRISRIAAGASWQGEYGDVNADPAVEAFWMKTSPYQNLKPGVKYPEPFIFTTTKDDRVGPQHARKFAARMAEYHLPYYFYENTEGGHGSGADLIQQAHTIALHMTYLQSKLMD